MLKLNLIKIYIFQLSLKIALTLFISLLVLGLGGLLGLKHLQNQLFSSPFECGLSPFKTSKVIFSSRFFVMALIFLIFDTELILLFPFLNTCLNLLVSSLFLILFFVALLSYGLYYEWSAAVLEWLY